MARDNAAAGGARQPPPGGLKGGACLTSLLPYYSTILLPCPVRAGLCGVEARLGRWRADLTAFRSGGASVPARARVAFRFVRPIAVQNGGWRAHRATAGF